MSRTTLAVMALMFPLAASADTGGGMLSSPEELRPIVTVAGDEGAQADDRIRALNRGMREAYAETLARVSAGIDPVLVVQFDGVGGTFNLRDGNRFVRIQPVPAGYELAKSVAHVPLEIFVMLAPYLAAPTAGKWRDPMAATGKRIRAALEALDATSLAGSASEDARTVLAGSLAFVDDLLARETFSEDDLKAYNLGIFESVGGLRGYATELQIVAIVDLFQTWRAEMGEARWRDLSAVVLAPYTLSRETAVTQTLQRMMDPDRVDRRLIVVGGDFGNDVETAISVFGRLYLDGLAARLIFDQDTPLGEEMTRSLSTSRDLMAIPAREALDRILD
jgi:hypothetical protein